VKHAARVCLCGWVGCSGNEESDVHGNDMQKSKRDDIAEHDGYNQVAQHGERERPLPVPGSVRLNCLGRQFDGHGRNRLDYAPGGRAARVDCVALVILYVRNNCAVRMKTRMNYRRMRM